MQCGFTNYLNSIQLEEKTMDIIEMTRELGRALQNDERYIAMMSARQASDEDQALQEAIGEFNLKRMAISNEAQKDDRNEETLQRLNEEFLLRKSRGF